MTDDQNKTQTQNKNDYFIDLKDELEDLTKTIHKTLTEDQRQASVIISNNILKDIRRRQTTKNAPMLGASVLLAASSILTLFIAGSTEPEDKVIH